MALGLDASIPASTCSCLRGVVVGAVFILPKGRKNIAETLKPSLPETERSLCLFWVIGEALQPQGIPFSPKIGTEASLQSNSELSQRSFTSLLCLKCLVQLRTKFYGPQHRSNIRSARCSNGRSAGIGTEWGQHIPTSRFLLDSTNLSWVYHMHGRLWQLHIP